MMVIKEDWLQWFTGFLIKKSSASGVDTESNYKLANELQSRLLENSRKEKFIHLLQTIFGALI